MLRLPTENTSDREEKIMTEWVSKKLGEITQFIAKGIPPKYVEEENQYTVRVLNQKCNRNFEISYDESRIHNLAVKKVPEDKLLRYGDVLINSTGTGTAGRVAQLFNLPVPTTIDGHMILLRPVDEIDPIYYGYAVKSHQKKIESLAEGSTGQTEINRQRLKDEIIITFPKEKVIQKAIGTFLFQIDEIINNNKQINNNLEQQAKAIFKSWFVDFEPFDRQVPKTWINGVLGDFVEIKRGGSPRPIQNFLSDSGFHWLKISDATGISSPFINEIKEYIIEAGLKKTVYLKSGSLVLSNSATPGLPKILDIDTCIHDGWLYFPSSKFSNEYLYLYFKHIRDNLIALGNGSVFTNLKTDILKNYPTYLPTEDVLKKFDELVQPIFSMILSKTREIKRLAEIRDTLLPKLMSGELDVCDIEL